MQTTVINVRVANIRPQYADLRAWMTDPDNVYIGRKGIVFIDGVRFPQHDSVWANPFAIGAACTRAEAIEKYRAHITHYITTPDGARALEQLRGKCLGCWCHPQPCHGDVIVELLARAADRADRA